MEARLYDGVSGHPHEVDVTFADAAIALGNGQGWTETVAADLLKRVGHDASTLRLGRSDIAGWRLILPVDARDRVAALLGREERYGRWIDRVGLIPALVVGGIVTAAAVGFGYIAPHWIAPHVPMSWERNVGSAMVGDFGKLRCRNAAGQQALETLVERVAPGATKGPDALKVAALDVPVFNAAALPGGYIVVFKPAITETGSDALAGILAHEVAHVRRRHVAEALIREFGIGALIPPVRRRHRRQCRAARRAQLYPCQRGRGRRGCDRHAEAGRDIPQADCRVVPASPEAGSGLQRGIPAKPSPERQACPALRGELRSACDLSPGSRSQSGRRIIQHLLERSRAISQA
jgi:hypothetical protein